MKIKSLNLLTFCLTLTLTGCTTNTSEVSNVVSSTSETTSIASSEVTSDPISIEDSSSAIETTSEEEQIYPNFFTSDNPGYKKATTSLSSFTPTLFDASSFSTDSSVMAGEGVQHISYSFNLNNTHKVIAHVMEIDLTKASIATNYSASKACVADSITDFESTSDKKVIAGVNCDFFGGSSSINAYIKDQNIIKNGHNDNGTYDYTDIASDVPCSMPLLFGISGSTARIAPIVENKTKEETIKAKYIYKILASSNGTTYTTTTTYSKNATRLRTGTNILMDNTTITTLFEGTHIYKVKKDLSQGILTHGIIEESYVQEEEIRFQNTDSDFFYITSTNGLSLNYNVSDTIAITTGSSDSKWDGYTSVMGGRQALVENGEISSTVTKENTNGAQYTNIPRTCVGIKPDGTVLLTAIESLRYNSNLTTVLSSDSYGVNLPQLADFMRYLGCYDSVNFDGGGSTQLVTKTGINGEGDQALSVRSSDYGTYNVTSCRHVYNTFLVTTK